MRIATLVVLFMITTTSTYSQKNINIEPKHHKGEFFLYWGWNRDWYTDSDIHFEGDDFNFTLYDVQSHDKQNPFTVDPYLNPTQMTLPQTNFRLGYFYSDKYSISFGIDHMKYVVSQYQTAKISGNIENTETDYNGNYNNDDIEINPEFLQLEHTNGLNYANIELRRTDVLFDFNRIGVNNIELKHEEGIGAGILYPRTDCTLLDNERYDEFHLAGYGIGTNVALNLTFFKHFFIQTELKGGFINMPDIRITSNSGEKASQNFFFLQSNFVFGATFRLFKEKVTAPETK